MSHTTTTTAWIWRVALVALSLPSLIRGDCVCECGTIAKEVCMQDACDFICAAAGDYGGDCGKGVLQNCEEEECIGASMRVFSCTRQEWVLASEVLMGEELKTYTPDGNQVCSEVYYTFHHNHQERIGKSSQTAMEIQLSGSDEVIIVSKNHLLHVVEKENTQQYAAIPAQKIQIGSHMRTSNGSIQAVTGVQEKALEEGLVNILTMEGSLELENGVIVSTYAFHEGLYSTLFYPVRVLYWVGGSSVIDSVRPTLLELERRFKSSFVQVASLLSN